MAKTHVMVKFVQQRKDMRAVMKNMTLPNSGLTLLPRSNHTRCEQLTFVELYGFCLYCYSFQSLHSNIINTEAL